MIVKDRMASLEVPQIIMILPAAYLGHIYASPLQPRGTHQRRAASETDRLKAFDAAWAAWRAGAIQEKARDYLMQWSRGTRRRRPRPSHYSFLAHQVHGGGQPKAVAPDPPALPHSARPVMVATMGSNRALPVVPESDDDPGPDALGVNK